MKQIKWNDNWKFWEEKNAFALVWNIPEFAEDVTLPHDAMLLNPAKADSPNQGNTGFRNGAVYTYVKSVYAEKAWKNSRVVIRFEGVYMNTAVYVNGQLAGKNPYGYTTFDVELNDYLVYEQENEIRVQVRNGAMTNSRWYSGGGIYRDVYLLVSHLTAIDTDGVRIHTENADAKYGVVVVETDLFSKEVNRQKLQLITRIMDENGQIVAKDQQIVSIFGLKKKTVRQRITIRKPALWDCDHPTLYTCHSLLKQEKTQLDEQKNQFGIRTLALDAMRGLRVNGQTVKLRGACIHHDSGLLGAATYEQAQYRQVLKLKEAGFNAIRMSHHPMAPAMVRACDALGMYVMDEGFDMWNRTKSDYDYGIFFNEWWEKDIAAMVRKDYNHPSILLYSVGNEIPEIGTPQGADICQKLCEKVKAMDPYRYTMAAINGVFAAGDQVDEIVGDVSENLVEKGELDGNVNDFMTLMDAHMDEIVIHPAISKRLEIASAPLDIVGYNYMSARYESDQKKYPHRIIVGSETYPPEIARNWALVNHLSQVIGDFTWTGWDYLGEAGVGIPAYQPGEGGFGAQFPCQLAYTGDLDITGYRRPVSYFREIVFGLRKAPYLAVQNPYHYGEKLIKTPWILSDATASWTFPGCEGKTVIVEVYAPGKTVELLINKKTQGRKPAGEAVGFRTFFEVTYETGIIEAVCYDENEHPIEKCSLQTAEAEDQICLTREPNLPHNKLQTTIDEQPLIYVDIAIQDKNKMLVMGAEEILKIEVTGDATLEGFGSGNPKPAYNYRGNVTKTWNGKAQAILKKKPEFKEARVSVTGTKQKTNKSTRTATLVLT